MGQISNSAAAASIAPIVMTGDNGKKKKKVKRADKKGFKQDRYEAYQQRFHKGDFKTMQAKKAAATAAASKERIVFDDAERRSFLTSMHKKKNERRVTAFLDGKKKIARENSRLRREQREAGRQAYNKFAQVPILPNYRFQIPEFDPSAAAEDEDDENVEVEYDEDASSEYDDDGELIRRVKPKKKADKKKSDKKEAKRLSSSDKVEYGGDGAVDSSTVTVTVAPLFSKSATAPIPMPLPPGAGRKAIAAAAAHTGVMSSLADLPVAVAQELMKLRAERKGPSHTKAKVKTLKELEKIRKIQKHSRKGHGKKSTAGKRKNRK